MWAPLLASQLGRIIGCGSYGDLNRFLSGDNVLSIHAFGGLHLKKDGVRLTGGAAQRKRLAILVVLAAHRRTGISREKIAALFWPESDKARSRNALYQAVAAIRRDLGDDVITAGSTGDLTLNFEQISSDIADFREAIAARDPDTAVAVYAGPFLDGVFLRDSDEFERWAEDMRLACVTDYGGALRDLAKRDAEAGDHSAATRWLRRLADLDRLSASVAVLLMESLAAGGEREAAIRHGRDFADLVRTELGSEPDLRITSLIEDLQRRSDAKGARLAARNGEPESAADVAGTIVPTDAVRVDALPTSSAGHRSTELRGSAGESMPELARSRWRRSQSLTLAGAVVGVALAMLPFVRPSGSAAVAHADVDPHRVFIADFENRTGDSTFDLLGSTLADWVTRGVLEAGLTTVSDPLSRLAVRDARDSAALGRKDKGTAMAVATGAGTVVAGAIARQGENLVITSQITDYSGHRVLSALPPILTPVSEPLRQANELRERIAGALAVAVDRRVSSLTLPSSRPPTYAAYQQFVLGLQRYSHDEDGAIAFFERAYALDTTFALPMFWAAMAYGNGRRFAKRDSVIGLLSRRPPPSGSLEALQLQEFMTRDPEERLQIALRGAARSPGSTWSMSAGNELHDRNRMREAVEYYEQVDVERSWARGWPTYWLFYSRALHAIGNYEEEYRSIERGLKIDPDGPGIRFIEIRALAGLGRTTEVQERIAAFVKLMEPLGCAELWDVLEQAALEMQAHAQNTAAEMVIRSWIRICERELSERSDSLTSYRRVSWGIGLYRAGLLDSAQRVLKRVSGRVPDDPYVEVLVRARIGRIAARLGDRVGAEQEMHRILASGDHNRVVALPEFAAIASLLGEPARGFRALESATATLPYFRFHRDRDYANLWMYPPFAALATPR